MKELSIEQKAKAYDEALERAKKVYKYSSDIAEIKRIEDIFPELKESEDEKIRKEIINYLEPQGDCCGNKERWIAWLEKQGEKKSADKVEPKFKAGDWVVDNCGYVWKIEGILNQFYLLEGIEGGESRPTIEWVNNTFHHWSIQDAKDGDVLCTYECYEPKIVFVLKGTPKKHYALSYYCYYNIMYPHFDDGNNPGCLAPKNSDVKPAAKEQRDLLFQKMKEAGYEWNSDTFSCEASCCAFLDLIDD